MRLKPQGSGSGQWIDSGSTPPRGFIAVSVEFAMMPPAQRDGELIADLTSERASLGEAKWWASQGRRPQRRHDC